MLGEIFIVMSDREVLLASSPTMYRATLIAKNLAQNVNRTKSEKFCSILNSEFLQLK